MGQLALFCEDDLRNFNFYKFPKALFTEPEYRDLSDSAKILYMIFYDRLDIFHQRTGGRQRGDRFFIRIDNAFFRDVGVPFRVQVDIDRRKIDLSQQVT